MMNQLIYTALLIASLLSVGDITIPNVDHDDVNKCFIQFDKSVNSDIHHYMLIDEIFENNDPNNPHASFITRVYIEVFGEEAEESLYSSTIAINKVNNIDEARIYIKNNGISFADDGLKCVVSPVVLYKWILEGYIPT